MDGENHQASRSGSSSLPTGECVTLRPAESQGGSTVTCCGDAAQASEGFAHALEPLELNAPMVDVDTRDQAEDGE